METRRFMGIATKAISMNGSFEHHLEAQRFADGVANDAARAALRGVHNLILETAGGQLRFLPERYRPVHTFDVHFFYRIVEKLFREWTDKVKLLPEIPDNRDRLLQLPEAMTLVSAMHSEAARAGLANFIGLLLATPLPVGTVVDVLFCCRLLLVLLAPDSLERILSGAAECDAFVQWPD